MSKPDIWMPLFIGDYLADTMHLEAREHGAYLLLIMHYWRSGPLPDDDRKLAGIARVDRREWATEVGPVVRNFFTTEADGALHHKRIDQELQKAGIISQKRRDAANRRHGKTKEINGNGGGNEPQSSQQNRNTQPAKPMQLHSISTASALHMDTHARACASALPSQSHSERQNPPLAPPSGGAKKRGRALLPSDWKPNEAQRLIAADAGLDPGATAMNFLDYCLGQGRRLADIDAAWRVWCRVAASASQARKRPLNNGLLELHRRIEAGEDVVGSLLAEMEAERGTTH